MNNTQVCHTAYQFEEP